MPPSLLKTKERRDCDTFVPATMLSNELKTSRPPPFTTTFVAGSIWPVTLPARLTEALWRVRPTTLESVGLRAFEASV